MSKSSYAKNLPAKEASHFKRVVKYFEQKNYKNGLKFANLILSNPKFSEHGETLAMKGILLHYIGKKQEGEDYIKKGLKSNIQSFLCWHVYGLMQKNERKYEEAIKCYLQAYRLDSENLQVSRDLCSLQIQTRNFEGYKDIRYKMLMSKPGQKVSWLGYAVAQHLLNKHDLAVNFLNEYLKALTEVEPYDFETSEIMIYRIQILMEACKYNEALEYLVNNKSKIFDINTLLEFHVKLLMHCKQYEEAVNVAWKLLDRNPECKEYYEYLIMAFNKKESDLDVLLKAAARYPKSKFLSRHLLKFYTGPTFVISLDKYLRDGLAKGVPPLFTQIKFLYEDSDKTQIIDNLLTAYRNNLKTTGTLGPIDMYKIEDKGVVEHPATHLWFNYLLCQHLMFNNKDDDALIIIHEQLKKTPTQVDFHVLAAQTYMNYGDYITASRWAEEAQSLDTADRYLNSICIKTMIKADRIEESERMASKFTLGKRSATETLIDVQCMWFLVENAKAYYRQKKLGLSLKFCHQIDRCYASNFNDQMDFHLYCLRKVTLKSYIDCIRWCDHVKDHFAYFEAASIAIKIYLYLLVFPNGEEVPEEEEKVLSAIELKKKKQKERKAALKAEAEAKRIKADQERRDKAIRSKQTAAEREADSYGNSQDLESLDPSKLIKPENPLEEATYFLIPLIEHFGQKIETHCLAFEVYSRKNMIALMCRAIKKGKSLPNASEHAWFHDCTVRFIIKAQEYLKNKKSCDSEAEKIYSEYMESEIQSLHLGESPKAFNDAFISKHSDIFMCKFRGLISQLYYAPQDSEKVLQSLPRPDKCDLQQLTWETALDALTILQDSKLNGITTISNDFIDKYRLSCATKFPYCSEFLKGSEKDSLRQKVIRQVDNTSSVGIYGRLGKDKSNDIGKLDRIEDLFSALSLNDAQQVTQHDHKCNGYANDVALSNKQTMKGK